MFRQAQEGCLCLTRALCAVLGGALVLAARSWLSTERGAAPAQASEHGGACADPAASLLTSVCTSSPSVPAAQGSQAPRAPLYAQVVPGGLLWYLEHFSVASQGQRHGMTSVPPPCSAAGCGREAAFLVHDPYQSPRRQALPTREAQQPGGKRRRKRLTP